MNAYLFRALVAVASVIFVSMSRADDAPPRPLVYWSAEPVMPGATAMIQGAGFTKDIKITLSDDAEKQHQVSVPVLDVTDTSLRFIVPNTFVAGRYDVRLESGAGQTLYALNASQPWCHQADFGQQAAPGGWIRLIGRCLSFPGSTPSIELRQSGRTWPLHLGVVTPWSIEAAINSGTPPGSYEIWSNNASADANGWVNAGSIEVVAQNSIWKSDVFDVTAFGAKPDDEIDDSEAFTKALDAIRKNNGGILQFPRGRFRLTGSFALPPNVLIRGAGTELTHLVWADTEQPPEALLSSATGEFGIANLSLYASNYRNGLIVQAPKGQAIAKNVRINSVRVRFTPLSVKGLKADSIEQRAAALSKSAVFNIFADNVQVVDCDFAWPTNVGLSVQGTDIVCCRNVAHADRGGWCPVGGGRRAIVEMNDFTGVTTGITRGAEVYFARNKVAHMYSGFREGFTTDGAFGGPGMLKQPQIQGTNIEFVSKVGRSESAAVPGVVRVIEGRGAGQYRMIRSYKNNHIEIDHPFDIAPDDTSILFASNAMMRQILFQNDMEDTGIAAQFYGGSLDCVLAENRCARSGGFRAWGNETCWYVQMLGNHIAEGYGTIGPEANAGSSALHVVGPYLTRNGDLFKGTTARGIVLRDNRLDNNSSIVLRGAIHDVLVERNVIRHSPLGIVGDLWQRQQGVLLRNNRFDDVDTPYQPVDAKYRRIDSN